MIKQMSNVAATESSVDLLSFFKALADETRLKIAALLARERHSGEQLADLLSIKPATVSHHLSKLMDAGLVTFTSEGRSKFYALRLDAVRATAGRLLAKDGGFQAPEDNETDSYDRKVLKDFCLSDGSLRQIPMQRKKFLAVLKHVVKDVEQGREYAEKQLNAVLAQRHADTATLRRGMIDYGLMIRKSGVYRRV